jgi:hypothetical protein
MIKLNITTTPPKLPDVIIGTLCLCLIAEISERRWLWQIYIAISTPL